MFTLSSMAIKDGYLDVKYGIDTPDMSTVKEGIPQVSFPIEWSGTPDGTKAFALEYMDYDNAEDEGVIWIHWIAVCTDGLKTFLAENAAETDASIIHGHNSWSLPYGPYENLSEQVRVGYGGPAPGRRHTYELTVSALDYVPDLKPGFYYADFRNAVNGHILETANLTMYYGRE